MKKFCIALFALVLFTPFVLKAQTSPVPRVSLAFKPLLTLQYDSLKKESSLVVTATTSIQAVGGDVRIPINYSFNIDVIGDTNQRTDVNSTTITVVPLSNLQTGGDDINVTKHYIIPSGKTVSFLLTKKMNPAQMFAGTYFAQISSVVYMDSSNLHDTVDLPSKPSNNVTIIGEVSPYIRSITSPINVNKGVSITGERFKSSQLIYIDRGMNSYVTFQADQYLSDANSIIFDPSIFNIQPGVHSLVILDKNTGESNNVQFELTGVPTGTTAKAQVVGTPALALTYTSGNLSTRREAGLIGRFQVVITTGNSPIILPTNSFGFEASDGNESHIIYNWTAPDEVNKKTNGYTIPANSTKIFTVTPMFNPAIMFAGNYKVSLRSISVGRDYENRIIVPTNSSNKVSIFGEYSPYINSISPTTVNTGQAVILTGARFVNNATRVYIDQTSYFENVSSPDGKTLKFTIPAGIDSGVHQVQVETKEGKSNTMSLTISDEGDGCTAFSRDLTLDSQGADVLNLQRFLVAQGYLAIAPTSYFGVTTKTAVQAWQAANGLSATGYFGPAARAYIATHCSPSIVTIYKPLKGDVIYKNTPTNIVWTGGGSSVLVAYNASGGEGKGVVGQYTREQAHCTASDKCWVEWKPEFTSPSVQLYIDDQATGKTAVSGEFSIVSSPQLSITVLAPNGGNVFTIGSKIDVAAIVNLPVGTRYEISLVGKAYEKIIGYGTVEARDIQKMSVLLPTDIRSTGNYYRIKVSCSSCVPPVEDQSDNDFTIVVPTPSQPAPTNVSISAGAYTGLSTQMSQGPIVTVPAGTTLVSLTWSSINATICSIVGTPINVGNGSKLSPSNSAVNMFVVDARNNNTYTITCSNDSGSSSNSVTVKIASQTPPQPNYDACRLDKLDGSNITRDAFTVQADCLSKICDIYGPANAKNNLASKCVFNGQEIKRYVPQPTTPIVVTPPTPSPTPEIGLPSTPLLKLTFDPINPDLPAGENVTVPWNTVSRVTWVSQNTTSCVVKGLDGAGNTWSRNDTTAGAFETGYMPLSEKFTVTCKGKDGSDITKTGSITVTPPKPTITTSCSAGKPTFSFSWWGGDVRENGGSHINVNYTREELNSNKGWAKPFTALGFTSDTFADTSGFFAFFNPTGTFELKSNTTYYFRIWYPKTQRYTEVVPVTTGNCATASAQTTNNSAAAAAASWIKGLFTN